MSLIGNLLLLVVLIAIIYLISYKNKKSSQVGDSSIQGKGLLATKDIKDKDVILANVFENKPDNIILYKNVSYNNFMRYLSVEGAKINHCSRNYNSKIITDDYSIYRLVATRNIKKGEEITVNYDHTNKLYPFIAGSKKDYISC
tara:strand:+ start:360 stop:791 length:432 start_codon:yes stop_codon:yes gene_type:complete